MCIRLMQNNFKYLEKKKKKNTEETLLAFVPYSFNFVFGSTDKLPAEPFVLREFGALLNMPAIQTKVGRR